MRIFHLLQPFKHVENSVRGVRRAKRLGFDAIDLDMQITKDGRVVCTHWGQPLALDGFVDPLHRIGRHTTVSELPWSKVRRLVVPRGMYRIRPLTRLLAECKRQNITAVIEPKADPRFVQDWVWQQIRCAQQATGARVKVRSLYTRNVTAATRNGFDAWHI